jgi:hypothetical protein
MSGQDYLHLQIGDRDEAFLPFDRTGPKRWRSVTFDLIRRFLREVEIWKDTRVHKGQLVKGLNVRA